MTTATTTATKSKPRCYRATEIITELDRLGRMLLTGHTVVGPTDHADLERKQGVYVVAAKRPGGWWEPVKVGHGGDVWDRIQTICAENWCARLGVQYFVLHTPGLRAAGRRRIESSTSAAFNL